ncbi:MAG: protein kinase [Archangiaceae bacterium]|nr:protein kinase [Archangiaceae bacterium]
MRPSDGGGDVDALLEALASAPPITPPHAPFVAEGRVLGHFRILERLGAGGSGVVYRAWDERLQRDVALKLLLSPERAADRILTEARQLAALKHPSIATVFEVGTVAEVTFLAMELCDGTPLRAHLAEGLDGSDVLALATQLAGGLAHLHAAGYVHRDLKPENLMVHDEQLKLLDFGTAASVAALAHGTASVGTPGYMAPEQQRGEPVDTRCDVYAFGVLLGEMLAAVELAQRGPRLTWSRLEALAARCRDHAAAARPADGAAVLRELEQVSRPARPLWLAAPAAVLVLALGVAFGAPERSYRYDERRLTARAHQALISDAAESPDGRHLAFIEGGHAFVQSLDSPAPEHELKLPAPGTSVDWLSSDTLVVGGESGVFRVSLGGGAPARLSARAVEVVRVAPDGRLALADAEGIWVRETDGREERRMPLEAARTLLAVAWSPDGKWLAFTEARRGPRALEARLAVVPAGGGAQRTVADDRTLVLESGSAALTWTSSGALLYASSQTLAGQPRAGLWSLAVRDGEPRGEPRALHTFSSGVPTSLSARTGRRILYVLQQSQVDTLVGRLEGGQLVASAPVVSSDFQERPSSWDDDGALYFVADGRGPVHVEAARDGRTTPHSRPGRSESWPAWHADVLLTWRFSEPFAEGARAELTRTDAQHPDGVALLSVPMAEEGKGNQLPPTNVRLRCPASDARCYLGQVEGHLLTVTPIDPLTGSRQPPLFESESLAATTVNGWDVAAGATTWAVVEHGVVELKPLGQKLSAPESCTAQHLSFAPDAASVFVTGMCTRPPLYRLWRAAPGEAPVVLSDSNAAWLAHPLPSPDGRRLAFAAKPHQHDVWSLEPTLAR